MSLLTPVKVPVKVYRWDDVGAPALDKTPNCMMTIFKACLVTGYGTKEGAGWTMLFEDTAAGVKVFQPEISPHTDFYLRMSSDNGSTITAALKTNVTDINGGDIIGELGTPFRYNFDDMSKWQMLCTGRTIWFFASCGAIENKKGVYFFCGDTCANHSGSRAVYINHTAGSWAAGIGARGNIFTPSNVPLGASYGRLFNPDTLTTSDATPQSWFDGASNLTASVHLSRAALIESGQLWALPIYGASNNSKDGFHVEEGGAGRFINNPTNPQSKDDGVYAKLDYWEY